MRLICIARAGLCNRIRTLLGAKSLADETHRELVVYWENSTACGCEWVDLFKPSVPVLKEKPAVDFAVGGPAKIRKAICADLVEAARSRQRSVAFSACALGTPAHHFHHFKSLFVPQEAIVERVKGLRRTFADIMLGVHVRCGDHAPDERAAFIELNGTTKEFFKMVKMMYQRIGAKGVFLASDDGASILHKDTSRTRYYGVYEAFVGVFESRQIIRQNAPILNRSTPQAIQDALVDLLLLRECNALCGYRGSSFSQIAAIGRSSIMLDFQSMARP